MPSLNRSCTTVVLSVGCSLERIQSSPCCCAGKCDQVRKIGICGRKSGPKRTFAIVNMAQYSSCIVAIRCNAVNCTAPYLVLSVPLSVEVSQDKLSRTSTKCTIILSTVLLFVAQKNRENSLSAEQLP